MRFKMLAGLAAVAVVWVVGIRTEEPPSTGLGDTPAAEPRPGVEEPEARTPTRGEQGESGTPKTRRHRENRQPREPERGTPPRTWLVTRVIDGDTIELGNGATVRIVGIDTPERGECGYDAATANMERLVLGEQVRLTVSDEDTDRYGRWLRYVDAGRVDAGLRQIKGGFAIARYDSRDGYGYHPREAAYIAADKANRSISCPRPQPAPAPPAGGGCAPGYTPCVPPYPPDVDCADVDGPVTVTGADPHGLDADGDGVACEWG